MHLNDQPIYLKQFLYNLLYKWAKLIRMQVQSKSFSNNYNISQLIQLDCSTASLSSMLKRNDLTQASLGILLLLMATSINGGEVGITPMLSGIGYYEMVDKRGIEGASFAGGTEVVFYGQGMSHTPTSMSAIFSNANMGSNEAGPPKDQDVAFSSHTDGGKLKYSTPSLMDIHGRPAEAFNQFTEVIYNVSLIDYDSMTQQLNGLQCGYPSPFQWCQIKYSRSYTPQLYYLMPPVIYSDSETSFWIDPRSAQNKKSTVFPEFPFTEVKLNGYHVNFEGFLEEDTVIPTYTKSNIRGYMGAVTPNKSVEVEFRYRVGYAQHYEQSMIRCSFDNQTCYKAKALGRIDAINVTSGYTTGSQLIRVDGYGFNTDPENITAIIDGSLCKVQTTDLHYFTCITSPKEVPSTSPGYFAGQHGLRKKFYNISSSNWFDYTSLYKFPFNESLGIELEGATKLKDGYYAMIYHGYFKAPISGRYRFYMSCDDNCRLYLGNTPLDPTSSQLILASDDWAPHRDYFKINMKKTTEWQTLEKDQFYYIELRHLQYGGGDHATVSVEIEDPNAVEGHHHSMREIQRLQFGQVNNRDSMNVTIVNPDGLGFYLFFQNPKDSIMWQSQYLTTNMSANDFNNNMKNFYINVWSSIISVTRTMYDASGEITTDVMLSKKTVFTVKLMKSITQASTNFIRVQSNSKATISITLPKNYQISDTPVTGSFKLKCVMPDGTWNQTVDMTSMLGLSNIITNIHNACPFYREKFELWEGPTYTYLDDGRDLLIRFRNLNMDIPQWEILSSTSNPLQGNEIYLNSTTWIPYSSQNLFYEPVPYEFLYTNETIPQVIVSVNGVEAVCTTLNCGYEYKEPLSVITGYSLDGQMLTIEGEGLTSDIQSITLGGVQCQDILFESDQLITCTLTQVAGSWRPILITKNGMIPLNTEDSIEVSLTITSIEPTTSLNPFGGTQLTITGANLPQSTSDISVTFEDGTICEIESVSSTIVTCVTEEFTEGFTNGYINVTVNGKSDTSVSVSTSNGPAFVSAIEPSSVNPVLKSIIKFTVEDFTGTLDKNDLIVSFTQFKDPSITYFSNVIEVGIEDEATNIQYFKIKFGGAESGTYTPKIRSKTYGRFDASQISLVTEGKVLDFNPKKGSIHGGTLITIDGINFSNDTLDNPVKIGYTDCMVESSTPTQIKCRTDPYINEEDATEDFIVFLKTYEEAKCLASPCTFEWVKTGLPTISDYSVEYDETLNDYVVTLIGTYFGATTTNTQFYIDEVEQTIISASDTELKVQIIYIETQQTLNVDIYLPIGIPDGIEALTTTTGISVTPKLLSINVNAGSPGGTLITAYVKGVGTLTSGVTLTTSTNYDICQSVKMLKYGDFQCKTKQMTIGATSFKLKVGSTSYSCSGSNGECNYETQTTFPSISTATATDSYSIQFTGTGFTTLSGFEALVSFLNIEADSVIVNSDTDLVATFTNGIPIGNGVVPQLSFSEASSNITHWALNSATVTNTVSSTIQIESSVQCSFAGGCSLKINQPGLIQNLLNDTSSNAIRICGQVCTPQPSLSDAASLSCALPPLATTKSVTDFTIIGESYLYGTPFSSLAAQTLSVWDGSHQNGWTDTAKNCYFGTAFKTGYIGVINEVKYFMSRFTKVDFVGKLRFEGAQSSAGPWETIFTVGQEIHEGWNYHNYDSGKELKYRYYRFFGTGTGSCIVGEVSLRGYEVIDDTNEDYTCSAKLILNGISVADISGSITYKSSLTPLLEQINPRFGSVVGGEEVTFTGSNFPPEAGIYTILIDGRNCAVQSVTATEIRCTTSKRSGLYPNPTLSIYAEGFGYVATQGLLFRYVNYWSQDVTWGGEFAPTTGDMVYVPKGLHLLVDVDSTPVLSAVVVEGSLIFPPDSDPEHLRSFDAHYVLVRSGYFEAGTEDFPYTSKLQITMHSKRFDPELPIFGNKVIAMYNGVLDMHGITRNPAWTMLENTIEEGSRQLTLIRDIDWKVGERIVVAPTGYYNFEAEERVITAVDNSNPDKPIITVNEPFYHKHFGEVQWFDDDFIEMRAEVGLLTRNILYRGDPETSARNEYGAHIMVHSNGMETLTARIEYVEFFNVGQAFQLGRYPIHFHLIGAVHNSYIKGNAIHQSYNRACTIHGVHYLRIIQNVAYNTKGHTFFIEDAAETHNYLEGNLAIWTKKSWSLLNSDQTPASFWITHPDNIFRGNHAAGSDNYGFWFDTKPNPTGPSFDPNVCPENSPLGEFTNNVAHSNGRYGLRLFHNLNPRQFPCKEIVYDPTNTTDPYWQNPLITARFINFTSYKNQRNGAIAFDVGDVRLENFKVADNLLAGIEFEKTLNITNGTGVHIYNALIVGRSKNADELTNTTDSRGIIGSRTENFYVNKVRFYGFDVGDKAAIAACSHCFSPPSTDSGARTASFSNLHFDPATVTRKIRYQEPWRDIYFDIDGSLTGLGPGSWATPYWRHNHQPECQKRLAEYDGLICNSSVQVRRVVFYKYLPNYFENMDMKIIQWDGVDSMDNQTLASYKASVDNYSIVPFKMKMEPNNAWAMPFVTGYRYKVHWQWGLDFTQMSVNLSEWWQPGDRGITYVHNFTDVRAKVEFVSGGESVGNGTLLSQDGSVLQTGANVVYNDTANRQIQFLINGKNTSRKMLSLQTYRCVGPCDGGATTVVVESNIKYWSNATSWPSGKVPAQGEDIVIEAGKNYVYDLAESPIYNYIQINGRVTFLESSPKLHLRAHYILVRAGEFLIGNQTHPFKGEAMITLFGNKDTQSIVFDNAIEAGNKVLANTNLMAFYGKHRVNRARLLQTANPGDTILFIEPGLSWLPGEQVGIIPTRIMWYEGDYRMVKSYDNSTGRLELTEGVEYYHWGAEESTGAEYSGVDMRGEIVLLSRNIKIRANDTDRWGCQVLTSSFIEGNGESRDGKTFLDHVEIFNCSQYDTFHGAVRFEISWGKWSNISNCAIHHGYGYGVQIMQSGHVYFQNNIVYGFTRFGINIGSSSNITIDGNFISRIDARAGILTALLGDTQGAVVGCAKEPGDFCNDIFIINNIASGVQAAGVDTTGFVQNGHQCGDYSKPYFRNNLAHSIEGTGSIIFRGGNSKDLDKCIEGSYFVAYKCAGAGMVSNQYTNGIIFSHLIMIDNAFGVSADIGVEGLDQFARLKNITFYGETEVRDCEIQGVCQMGGAWKNNGCVDRAAIMPSSYADHHKTPLIGGVPYFPQYKIKGDGSFGGHTIYENITFKNYKEEYNWCGSDQRIFRLNPFNSDYYPRTYLNNVRFHNVGQNALAYLFTPPNEWAVLDDCGQFPCTGPNNVLIWLDKVTYSGQITPLKTASEFMIISGNDENSGGFDNCFKVAAWNGYYCENDQLALLTFDSQDDDRQTRLVSPVVVMSKNLTSRNVLNTFMDHAWDGFYTSMKRTSRFPTLLQGGANMYYNITFTGTPPQKLLFNLRADYTSVIIQIRYPKPGAYIVQDYRGNEIKANGWDSSISGPATIRSKQCGENRYVGIVNTLEFYLSPLCNISIVPIDSIQTSVRLNWTVNEFYSAGGTTKFQDRIAASLGIKPANIKIVSVYQGSVFVDFQIQDDASGSVSKVGGLKNVQTSLTTILTSGKVDLGAPILSVSVTTIGASSSSSSSNSSTSSLTSQNQSTGKVPVQPVYINNTIIQVSTQSDGSGKDNTILVIAVLASIVGLLLISGAGYFAYTKFKRIPSVTLEVVNQSTTRNEINSPSVMGGMSPDFEGDILEAQYHPGENLDLILGRGLKKANEGDDLADEEVVQKAGSEVDTHMYGSFDKVANE
ncbi:hypothetical protein FGO68_gene8985 [Halteria grandinella]|uniref:Fibrocystin-L n=1 Tax=Halteria grandinella TaxID=5974 RepID=A0A8J8PA31_HALGN|nr:hypothetical protein FGO68_gene8985 [Halteria grandinella]